MVKKKITPKKPNEPIEEKPCCVTCANFMPIGEGDHICTGFSSEPVLVMEDYEPTDEYFICGGSCYEED